MGFSPALSAYLFFSRHSKRMAERALARRLAEGKEDPARVDERRGVPSAPRPKGDLIWFHAASVGEALSIQELIHRLHEEDASLQFLITTVTVTSAQAVETRLPPNAEHQFIPVDVHDYVAQFLDHWRPQLAVWTESELWPELITATRKRGIPMLLINARMSAQSYRRWRWMRGATRLMLNAFSAIHAQDDEIRDRLLRLGAAPDLVTVTGTLKEGSSALPYNEAQRAELARAVGERALWLAASTHPGEEEIAARAHRDVLRRAPRMLLILVPRHPERGPQVADEMRNHGWRTALRSAGDPMLPDTEIYVADTLGEMGLWYRLAPISFVGGSLVPIGGHNPFEPAALGSAILHGPHVTNFRDIYDRLAVGNAARLVHGPDDLAAEVIRLLAPDMVADMAHAAWEVCSSGAEVTDRALELIFDHLGTKP